MALDCEHGLHGCLVVERAEMFCYVYGIFKIVAQHLVCGTVSLGEIVFKYSLAYPQGVYGSCGTLEAVHDGGGVCTVEIVYPGYLHSLLA